MTKRILTLGLLISIACSGCKSKQSTDSDASSSNGETRSTLELDPANPIVIAGWWDNGRYLLEVEYDFAYRIRQGHYPDSTVIERGRWTRDNHADFELEPYNVGKVQPERVALSLDKGDPVATIKGLAPFRKLSKPPRKLVDQLVGTWRGTPGTLLLERNGAFALKKSDEDDPIDGAWRIERGSLILDPSASSEDPEVLTLRKAKRGQVVAILGLEAPLERAQSQANPR